MLSLVFISIKSKKTQLCEDDGLNIILVTMTLWIVSGLNVYFGDAGINAALSSGYIFFETTQSYYASADELNHYLWVYILVSMVGGACGGVLHWIHSMCSNSEGRDNDKEELLDLKD